MINRKTLEMVKEEMHRLERNINELHLARMKSEQTAPPYLGDTPLYYDFPRQTGAVRRASMDLSRALVQLRKSGQ